MNDFVEEQMGRRGRQTIRKWTHVHLLSSFAASSSCVSLFLRPEWHRTEALFPLVLLLKSRPKSGQDALPALPKKRRRRRRRRPNVPTFIDPPPSSSQGGCLLWFSSVSYILYNRLLFFFVHFTIFFKFTATTSRPAITSMIHLKVETAKTTPSSSHRGIGEIFLKQKVPLFCRGGEASSGKLIIIRGSGPVSGERIWKEKKKFIPQRNFCVCPWPRQRQVRKRIQKKKGKIVESKSGRRFFLQWHVTCCQNRNHRNEKKELASLSSQRRAN